MAHINPTLPVVGGDENVWGDKENAAESVEIAKINELDDRAGALETTTGTANGRITALEVGAITKPTGGTDGQPLVKSGSTLAWGVAGGAAGFSVVDNGDGTFTMSGTAVADNGNGTVTITY